jgi:hypothetical protein
VSLYRQPGRTAARTLAAVGAVAALAGGAIGYAVGSSGGEESPSLAEAVSALRADLAPVRNGLDFVPTEYREGVRDGRVVSEPEYGAAKAAVARARDVLAEQDADLRALAPARAAGLRAAFDELAAAIDQRAEPADVERRVERVRDRLAALVG